MSVAKGPKPRPVAERLWEKALADGTGCWIWQGFLNAGGYGLIKAENKTARAHRVAYEIVKGPIPEGLQLDHLCRRPACINPNHLEAVTGRVNTLRGQTIAAKNAGKIECDQGHTFDEENTYHYPRGTRSCRKCQRAAEARYKQRRSATDQPSVEQA